MPDLASGLQQVTAVAVLPEAETHRALRHMFAHANWILLAAGDRRSGLAILANEPVAAVISECRLHDGIWHDLLNDLAQFEVPPRPDRDVPYCRRASVGGGAQPRRI